jgi:ABC-2 type transport system ATP-binding protein
MSEMALTAQHLIVIGRGRLIADTGMEEFIAAAAPGRCGCAAATLTAWRPCCARREVAVSGADDGALTVSGLSTDQVGRLAGAAGITLLELTARRASLEEAFMGPDQGRGRVPRPQHGGAQP